MTSKRWRYTLVGTCLAALAVGGAISDELASAAPAAHAHKAAKKSAAPGSGLGAIVVSGTATGIRAPFYSNGGKDVEGEIPYATADLSSGVGQAVASVFWPGETGATGGSAIQALSIKQVPDSVSQQLNDPEKAEAQTGVGDPVVTNNQPGVDQTATAKPNLVSASAGSSASALPAIGKSFGETHATTTIKVTGPKTVTASAISSAHDLTIAGVLKIGAVRSVATAVTRGKSGTGSAHTYVSDATVAGVRVAIDADGVHVTQKQKKKSGGLLPVKLPSLDDVVNKALKQSGISVKTTKAKRSVKKAHVVLDTGALVVGFAQKDYKAQGNDTGDVLIIGGAKLDANSTPGFAPPPPIKPVAPPVDPGTGTTTGGTAGTAGVPGTPGTAGTTIPGDTAPEVAGTASSGPAQLAASSRPLFTGLRLWWVLLALAAAGFMAAGLKRLPDRVLEAPAVVCTLEDA